MIALLAALAIARGALAPSVMLTDQNGRARAVPGPKPVLVIYEDQDAGKQNPRAKAEIGRLNSIVSNQSKLDVLPVADLEKWDWWPARKYALADVQKTAARERATVYVDWKGAVRKAWSLPRGQSCLVLVATDGRVLWSSQGPLDPASLQKLLAVLATLGFHG